MHYLTLNTYDKEKIVDILLNTAIPLYKEHTEIMKQNLSISNVNYLKDEKTLEKYNNYIDNLFQLLYIKPINTIINIIYESIYDDTNKVYFTVKQRKIIDRWLNA